MEESRNTDRVPSGDEDSWLRFLVDEGLDVIAAYRSIANPSVRAMFIRLMKEAAQAERNGDPALN